MVFTNIDESLEFVRVNYSGDTDIPALRSELSLLPAIFRESLRDIACFEVFFEKLKERPTGEHHLISKVVTICKLLHVNPATSASGEQSFSMTRRLKIWLRSNRTHESFNALAILHAHKERIYTPSLIDIGYSLVCNENRHMNFGRFVKDDEL